jgi:ribosome-binding protein aMBF1 (putative translation factor)
MHLGGKCICLRIVGLRIVSLRIIGLLKNCRRIVFIPANCQGMKSRKSLTQAFGNVMRTFRSQTGMSQEDLADAAGFHRTYIGGVEHGRSNISLKNIDRLLNTLNKSWVEFAKALEDEIDRK